LLALTADLSKTKDRCRALGGREISGTHLYCYKIDNQTSGTTTQVCSSEALVNTLQVLDVR